MMMKGAPGMHGAARRPRRTGPPLGSRGRKGIHPGPSSGPGVTGTGRGASRRTAMRGPLTALASPGLAHSAGRKGRGSRASRPAAIPSKGAEVFGPRRVISPFIEGAPSSARSTPVGALGVIAGPKGAKTRSLAGISICGIAIGRSLGAARCRATSQTTRTEGEGGALKACAVIGRRTGTPPTSLGVAIVIATTVGAPGVDRAGAFRGTCIGRATATASLGRSKSAIRVGRTATAQIIRVPGLAIAGGPT